MPDTPRPADHRELIDAASNRGTVRGADVVHDAAGQEVDQNVIVLSSSGDWRRLSRGRATALVVAAAVALALATTMTVRLAGDTGGETLDVGGPPSTQPEPSPPPAPAGRPDVTVPWSEPTTTTTATTAPPPAEAPPPTDAPAPPPPPIAEPLPPPVDRPPVSPTTTEPSPFGPMQVKSPLNRGEIFVVTLPHLGTPDELYGANYTLRSLDGGPAYYLIADTPNPLDAWCQIPCRDDWAVPASGYPPGTEATLGIPREVEPGRYELCNSGQCARVDIR